MAAAAAADDLTVGRHGHPPRHSTAVTLGEPRCDSNILRGSGSRNSGSNSSCKINTGAHHSSSLRHPALASLAAEGALKQP